MMSLKKRINWAGHRIFFPHLIKSTFINLDNLSKAWIVVEFHPAERLYKEAITTQIPVLHWVKQDGAVMMR